MEMVTYLVFMPLTLLAMAAALNGHLREKALGCRAVAALEARLAHADRLYGLLFALCMLAGAASRCVRFLELPMGVNQDGMMAAVEAFCLAQGGTDQFGTSWPTYFEAWSYSQMSTLYPYLMIPFIKIMGLSKLTLRLPMLLISLATLPLIWDFARRIFDKNFALLVLFVAATNPWHMVQSRWALEANLFPHVLLLGCYLLLIGRKSRPALYASMIVFALTPYAYGLACFSVPVILLGMAVYYLARKKANVLDVLVCVALFAVVGGPYFMTMAINALGLETMQLGPITMPFFEMSHRTNDMPFFMQNPYAEVLKNFPLHLSAHLFGRHGSWFNVVPWAHAMYLFTQPLYLYGMYKMWRGRRMQVLLEEDSAARDGQMLLLLWLLAATVNGFCIGSVINRNNILYYPLIFMLGYGLYLVGCRLRAALALLLALLTVAFGALNVTYFTDESYQQRVASSFRSGLVDALEDTWDWDYDEVYITSGETLASRLIAEAAVMFAHKIDYAGRSEQTELLNHQGEATGWYFTERYHAVDFTEYEPDPMDCSVYIITQAEKQYFDEADYILTDYDGFAAAYPRYWAE